jgi:hypothetical protein
MSYKRQKDNPDKNAGEIRAFLSSHGIEVIRINQPLDCLVFNGEQAGWLEIKTEDKDAKVKRSQIKFMSETNMPCAFAKNEGEALIFAETMQGLTPRDKDRLAAFLVRNQAKEWRMSVIEKVLRGERA